MLAPHSTRPGRKNAKVIEKVRRYLGEEEPLLYLQAVHCVVRSGLGRGEAALEIARDLLQELCVEALRSAENFDPKRGPLAHWICGILWNLARRHQKQGPYIDLELHLSEDASAFDVLVDYIEEYTPGPETALLARDEINRARPLLHPAELEVVDALLVCALDTRAAAECLGLSEYAVRTRFCRARKHLYRILTRLRAGEHP